MINLKGFGRKWSWPNFTLLCLHSPGGTEENLSQVSRSPDRDLKPEAREYKAGELTAETGRSVELNLPSPQ
jgi:hypothetical protein